MSTLETPVILRFEAVADIWLDREFRGGDAPVLIPAGTRCWQERTAAAWELAYVRTDEGWRPVANFVSCGFPADRVRFVRACPAPPEGES